MHCAVITVIIGWGESGEAIAILQVSNKAVFPALSKYFSGKDVSPLEKNFPVYAYAKAPSTLAILSNFTKSNVSIPTSTPV